MRVTTHGSLKLKVSLKGIKQRARTSFQQHTISTTPLSSLLSVLVESRKRQVSHARSQVAVNKGLAKADVEVRLFQRTSFVAPRHPIPLIRGENMSNKSRHSETALQFALRPALRGRGMRF
jgi:hypothetical protein